MCYVHETSSRYSKILFFILLLEYNYPVIVTVSNNYTSIQVIVSPLW